MTLFAKVVTSATIDEITKLNGGVKPHQSTLEIDTFFIYSDDENTPNLLVTRETFERDFAWENDDSADNVVVPL